MMMMNNEESSDSSEDISRTEERNPMMHPQPPYNPLMLKDYNSDDAFSSLLALKHPLRNPFDVNQYPDPLQQPEDSLPNNQTQEPKSIF